VFSIFTYLWLCFLWFLVALVRQTDPNWEAFFFLTDEKPFEKRLAQILAGFNDTRLNFFDVPVAYRPVVSKEF
jgi:hypothetical protein